MGKEHQHERKGNIPCDLHMEHLNIRLKTVLRSMGANITSAAILLANKSLYAVQNACLLQHYDMEQLIWNLKTTLNNWLANYPITIAAKL